MIFGKTKLELKVGIFVFIGLVILFVFILSIGGFKTWTSGYRVKFIYNFTNGVKLGAPVRFAGVDVGEVKTIELFYSSIESRLKVRLNCWLKKSVKIPMDSKIWINTLGLLGEKYIEIIPGKDYSRYLALNQELAGEDPVPMNEIFGMVKGITDGMKETLDKINNGQGTIGKLMNDDGVYQNIEDLTLDLKKHPWKLIWKTKENK